MIFLVTELSLVHLGPAVAAERRTVKSGQEVVLQAYYRYRRRDCKSMKVVVKIVKSGDHGRVREGVGHHDPYYAKATDAWGARCTGIKIRSHVFYYRAKKGFRGTDHVILRPVGFMAGGRNEHFYITVE